MNRLQKRQRGLTLPELMVAVLLGTIVTGAVLGMYLSTSRTFSQDERYALMQENGRYALRTLAEDVTMADFWGKMTANFAIGAPAFGLAGECADGDPGTTFAASDGIGLYDGATGILYNNANNAPKFQLDPDCDAVYANQRANTNILVIKRTKGVPETTFEAGVTRLRSNGIDGSFVNDTTAPPAGFSDWRYMPRIYFIRTYFDDPADGIPSLCRLDLVDNDPGDGIEDGTNDGAVNTTGTPAMGNLTEFPDIGDGRVDSAVCIAEGIEQFHIQFGIDTDGDGVANQYNSSPTMVVAAPGTAEMEGVVSARIFILARSSEPDPQFTDTKSFVLGDFNVAAANDGFYRRVFTTTVMVRNSVNLNLLNN